MLTRPDRSPAPGDAPGILTARTLANGHPDLLALLRPGLDVLDVGCGPGALTIETARRVLPGRVVGLDINREMLAAARQASPPGALPNLAFREGDIREGGWDTEFDLVSATRVLQWIPDLERALAVMAAATRRGGLVVVRDYDHARARWLSPPAAWTRFHLAFLDWRAQGGLDNASPGGCPFSSRRRAWSSFARFRAPSPSERASPISSAWPARGGWWRRAAGAR